MKTAFQKKYPAQHAFTLGCANGKLVREQEEEESASTLGEKKVRRPTDDEWETAFECDSASTEVMKEMETNATYESVVQAWIDGCNAGWDQWQEEAEQRGLRECND